MDHLLTQEQELIVATIRRFVRKELWLWEKRIDSDAVALPDEVHADLLTKTQATGLYQLRAPQPFREPSPSSAPPNETGDSIPLELVTAARAAEETSQHRAGVIAPTYDLFGPDVPPRLYAATPEQQQRFLWPVLRGEACAFSGLTDPAGSAHPTDGTRIRARWTGSEWMLDGTKLFVTGEERADFGLVFANTEDPDGTRRGVSLFAVESHRDGFQRWRPYRTLSPGRDVMELNLSNLRIPPENLLGEVGAGAGFGESFLVRRRVFAAAELTGVASAAQDMARGQANARQEFGAAIAEQQGVRWALADNQIAVEASRLLYLSAAAALDRSGETRGDEGIARAEVSAARLHAATTAQEVVDRTIQLHAGAGVSADLPLERWYRDLRLHRIDDGGDAAHREAIAAHLLSTFKK
ncbi:MAG TPA: acyl-CoA dehydrogenase family protein [Dehalococcoidia bacterium]|nr:acyl-CoA dehydrogenase family protein [Dehalococcoidia bacterium]